MTTIATVSNVAVPGRDFHREVREILGDEATILDFSTDREGLARRGGAAEIVVGNVRPFELAALPRLRWIQTTWGGVENLLYPEMLARGVIITNVRGQAALPMSEHALAAILYLLRDFPAFAQAGRAGEWRPAATPLLLHGSRILLLGVGAIGRVLLPKLTALGARVTGVNSSGAPVAGCETVGTLATLHEHLADVDIAVNLLPSTPLTAGVLDARFFAGLKPGAGFVNLSRGAVVDEAALVAAINTGHVRGAVLDVTHPEPPPAGSPLWGHERILLTGHRSWTPGGDPQMWLDVFLHNLACYRGGRFDGMQNRVNPELGY